MFGCDHSSHFLALPLFLYWSFWAFCFCMYQEAENAVDFILISRPLKSNAQPGVADAHHVFSHHACHCRQEYTKALLVCSGCSVFFCTFFNHLVVNYYFHLQHCEHESNNMGSWWTSNKTSRLFFLILRNKF